MKIDIQTTISEQSISLSLGQYARNNPTSYEIVSMIRISGPDPGPITLEASNSGVVTRVGGAVAPSVTSRVLYTVTIRAINAGGSSDCPFDWQILEKEQPPPSSAFVSYSYRSSGTPGYDLARWNSETGAPVSPKYPMASSNKGDLYIQGVGSIIYGMFTTKELVRINYDGSTASISVLGDITASEVTAFQGLTEAHGVLYSFGNTSSGWKLYTIDTSTRNASPVNSASGANNLGLTGSAFMPGGLAAISGTIYAFFRTALSNWAFVSMPTTGNTRGIATVINSSFAFTDRTPTGLESFGTTIQSIQRVVRRTSGEIVFAYNIDRSDGTVEDTLFSTTYFAGSPLSITGYSLSAPTITRIPTQRVQEGQPISFPMSAYVTGANRYSLGPVVKVTTGAPELPLTINAGGIITGTVGNLNAPQVNTNSYYTVTLFAYNSAGPDSEPVTIGVLNSAPAWSAIPPQFVNEGQRISFSVAAFVRNQPTHFTLGNITKPSPESPNLELQITRNGTIIGVGGTINAPDVDEDSAYTIPVIAENSAGPSSTTVQLTVVDLGALSEQVPYVLRWDTPEGAQRDDFEILIDFNIPVYALEPSSFVFDGIVLRGQPYLQWSPVPAVDTPANRPNSAQRSLDYLTTPVPANGTKYYKLVFPREILPEIIEENDLLNFYLTAHAARGGVG